MIRVTALPCKTFSISIGRYIEMCGLLLYPCGLMSAWAFVLWAFVRLLNTCHQRTPTKLNYQHSAGTTMPDNGKITLLQEHGQIWTRSERSPADRLTACSNSSANIHPGWNVEMHCTVSKTGTTRPAWLPSHNNNWAVGSMPDAIEKNKLKMNNKDWDKNVKTEITVLKPQQCTDITTSFNSKTAFSPVMTSKSESGQHRND